MKPKQLLQLFIAISGLTIYLSCRKTDSKHQSETNDINRNKFFQEHLPSQPLVSVARQFVMNENARHDFVDKLSASIGYPYWDKSVIAFRNQPVSRTATGEEGTVFVPFVPEGDSTVKATLVIKIEPGDTSFHFIGNWQYRDRIHGSMTNDSTAENTAALFMLLHKQVFGDSKFRITDSSLFADLPVPPGLTGREIVIEDAPPGTGRTSNYTLLYCFYGYVCGTPSYAGCTDANGCDYQNCPSGQCYATSTCIEFEVEEGTGGGGPAGGGGPGGGTGGSGGGSGGGGTGGGWNPPPCPGAVAARVNTYDICTPGWYTPDELETIIGNTTFVSPPSDTTLLIADIDSFFKCFTFSSTDMYKITIAVDQPVPGHRTAYTFGNGGGSGSSTSGPVNIGHTFFIIEQIGPVTNINRTFGFYPISGVKPASPTDNGILLKDKNHWYDVSLTMTVSAAQFFNFISNVKSHSTDTYNLNSNNCSSFCTKRVQEIGINLVTTIGHWPMGGSGINPGDLGEDIRAMQLQPNMTRQLTGSYAPNHFDC